MAGYGASGFRWAPVVSDADPENLPTYGPALSMGPLNSVTYSIVTTNAENHGDDELQDFIEEFQRLDVDMVSTDIPPETSSAFLGATLDEDGTLHLNNNDVAPYGGAAYINRRGKRNENGTYTPYFRVMIFPMIKGRQNGATDNTKSGSITFANDSAHFTGKAAANGDYVTRRDFPTMVAARTWLDSVMPMASAST